ncbi:MAG: transcriptional regulator [Fluviicola sp.]|nr:MAG: transcriptional regulator [Fluviicola sp.]
MSIQERLKMVMKMNNLSAAAFADRVGVQRSSISHIMSGRNKPSLDFIQKTLKSFPRVNGDWLVTGKPVGGNRDEESYQLDTVTKPINTTSSEDIVGSSAKSKIGEQESKQIERIVVFYSDGTYTETTPKD